MEHEVYYSNADPAQYPKRLLKHLEWNPKKELDLEIPREAYEKEAENSEEEGLNSCKRDYFYGDMMKRKSSGQLQEETERKRRAMEKKLLRAKIAARLCKLMMYNQNL